MAAKMAIKDVARVLKLELSEANRLAKMVPEAPKMTLKKAYKENPDLEKEKQSLNPLISKTIQFAETLEGSIRQTGVHACGILISRDPLTDHIPIMPTEGESLMTTQYDGHFVEPIGLIKMDFLGLRTLSIIKTCLDNIKKSKHIVLNENEIPLDDEETFKLFTRGRYHRAVPVRVARNEKTPPPSSPTVSRTWLHEPPLCSVRGLWSISLPSSGANTAKNPLNTTIR